MELKKGYKQTDVGVIPEDWDVNTLASTTPPGLRNPIVDGPFGSNLKTIHYRKRGIPIVTSGYVTDGVFLANDYLYVDVSKFNKEKRSAVKAGDIVMAKIGARCGACAILPEWHATSILSGNALKITVDKKHHSTCYIWQVLWSFYLTGNIESLRTVGAQPAISMANLKKHLIPLPSLAEQEAIAEALSDADVLIESLEKLIAKKRNLKQGTMQQLLTGKKRLPGFTGKWETKKLGDMLAYEQPTKYLVNSTEYSDNNEIAVLTANKSFILGYTDETDGLFETVPVIIFDDFTTASKFVGFPFKVKSSALKILKLKDENYNLTFLFGKMQLIGFPLGEHKRYWISEYQHLTIEVPSFDEQNAIVQVLSDMDEEIEALEEKRDKYQDVKQGMLQQLLTGRIRLIKQKVVDTPMTAATRAPDTIDTSPKSGHNWQINEAVVIAALTSVFGSEQYPLGRKRYTKFSYLLHRHVEGKAEGYRKKAAGPYNPDTRYKGPEKIAQNNRYIKPHTNGEFSGFIADEGIEQARGYFDKWYGLQALQWLEQFRYERNEQLELLTTADMAVCELVENKQSVSVAGVKTVIRSHPEWKAKLNRPVFSDKNIATAIEQSQDLFGA